MPCPRAKALLGGRGYDADWFRAAVADRKIAVCIPSMVNRKMPIPHDAALYRQRHKIETMVGRRPIFALPGGGVGSPI
jgi:transposase